MDWNIRRYFTPPYSYVLYQEGQHVCPGVPLDVFQYEVAPFIGEAHASCLKADRDADAIIAAEFADNAKKSTEKGVEQSTDQNA